MGIDLNYSTDFDKGGSYKLAALIGEDNFFYGLYNADGDLVKSNYISKLSETSLTSVSGMRTLLENEGILQLNISRSTVGIDNNQFTFVPFAEYEKAKKTSYLVHTAAVNPTDEVLVDFKNSICTVFALDKMQLDLVHELFPNPEVMHVQTAIHGESVNAYRNATLVDVNAQGIKVFAFKNGKLMLGNNYKTTESLGVLYFTSLAYDQLALDRDSHPLFLSGNIDSDRKAYDLLYKYIRNVSFIETKSAGATAQGHQYYSLHCLSKCA